MSYIPPIDSSPYHSTSCDEDRIRDEDGLQTPTASPSTSSAARNPITPTSGTDVHHESSSKYVSKVLSLYLDTNLRRRSPAEGQVGVAPVDFVLYGFNETPSGEFEGSSSSAGYANYNLRRLAEAQQQPVQPTSSDVIDTSIPSGGSPRTISPAAWLKGQCEELRKKQEELKINIDGPSRAPVQADFPRALSMKIVNPVQPVESCIILLHNLADNEASLEEHVQTLKG